MIKIRWRERNSSPNPSQATGDRISSQRSYGARVVNRVTNATGGLLRRQQGFALVLILGLIFGLVFLGPLGPLSPTLPPPTLELAADNYNIDPVPDEAATIDDTADVPADASSAEPAVGQTTTVVDGSSAEPAASQTTASVITGPTTAASSAPDSSETITYYTIAASADAHGSISPSGTVTVDYGADQAFAIVPDADYHVQDVLVDGSSVGAVNSYTFAHVTGNHTIAASFASDSSETITYYTIAASADAHGSISPSGTVTVGYGADQVFTIVPNAGCHIQDVLVDGSSVGAVSSYTFTYVNANHSISASFTMASSSIVVAASSASSTDKARAHYICDGYADQAEIQAAIDSCSGTALQKVVLIGSFSISRSIVVESYVVLELQGKVTVANAANCYLLSATNKANFQIVGGEWDGNRANQTRGLYGFALISPSKFLIQGVEMHDVKKTESEDRGIGICCHAATFGRIEGNYVHDCGDSSNPGTMGEGIILTGSCMDNVVIDNTVSNCDGGIYVFASGATQTSLRNKVTNNHINNVMRDGIALYAAGGIVEYNEVEGNEVRSAGMNSMNASIVIGNLHAGDHNVVTGNTLIGDGVHSESGIVIVGNYCTVTNNKIDNHYGAGIELIDQDQDGSASHHNVITGNTITNSHSNGGIVIHAGDYNRIEGNTISLPGGLRGIWTKTGSEHNQLIDNTVSAPACYWLDIEAGANQNEVISNTVLAGTLNDNGTGTVFN